LGKSAPKKFKNRFSLAKQEVDASVNSEYIKMETILEFLENKIYLPGYVGILGQDYDKRNGVFDFKPIEPPVAKIVDYFTPRGAHIFLSQAGLCLIENILKTEDFDMNIQDYRDLTMQGRMKIIELNQKYRKELRLDKNLQGRLDLTKLRWGKTPIVNFDFDIGNKGVTGNFVCILAPKSVFQTNANILRN